MINNIVIGTTISILLIFSAISLDVHDFVVDRYSWHVEIGKKYSSINNYAKAMKHANRATAINDSRIEAHQLKGDLYWIMDLTNAAEQEYSLFKETNEQQYLYNYRMGRLRLRQGLVDDAYTYFNISLHKSPSAPHTWGYLALIQIHRNDTKTALYSLSMSEEIAKNQGSTKSLIGTIRAAKNLITNESLFVLPHSKRTVQEILNQMK